MPIQQGILRISLQAWIDLEEILEAIVEQIVLELRQTDIDKVIPKRIEVDLDNRGEELLQMLDLWLKVQINMIQMR